MSTIEHMTEGVKDWLSSHCDYGKFDKHTITDVTEDYTGEQYDSEENSAAFFEVEFTAYGKTVEFQAEMDCFREVELQVLLGEDNWEDVSLNSGPFWLAVLEWPKEVS